MGQPSTKPIAFELINAILSAPKQAAVMKENVTRMNEVGKNEDQTTVKIFMQLIGVLFSNYYAPLFAKLNDPLTSADFEKKKGRKHEGFFALVSNEVNGDLNKMHFLLHQCKDEMLKPEYDQYLSDEEKTKFVLNARFCICCSARFQGRTICKLAHRSTIASRIPEY